jgi:cell division septal protein FtsQ
MTRYISREKKKKKKKLLPGSGFFSYLFLFSSLLFLLFYFLGVQKFIEIDSFVINADQETLLSEEELIKEVENYTSTKNIFLSKEEKIINIIKKEEPTTNEVVIEKIFPSKLIINITSRIPHLVWCKDEDFKNCFYVDKEGVTFKKAKGDEDFLIFVNSSNFNLGDSVISKDLIEKLFYLEKELSEINFKISFFDTTDQKIIKALTNDKFIIYFSNSSVEKEVEGLKALISKLPEEEIEEAEYIDLKFKNIILLK